MPSLINDQIGQTTFYSVWEPNTAILYRFADLEELFLPYRMQLKSRAHEYDSFLFFNAENFKTETFLGKSSKGFWSTYVSSGNQQ